jgi:hypothetical protein
MAATVAELGARVLRRLGIAIVAAGDRPAVATSTVQQIALRALQFLGVVASDETPLAQDLALAVDKVDAVHDGMISQGIVPWDLDHIPRSVSEEYVILVAIHLAPVFGKTADPAQEAAREARVRRAIMLTLAPKIAEQAVLDVHTQLDARGKTRWTSYDVPDHAEGAYVLMASCLVAPQFGIQADPAWWAQGEQAINRVISLPSSGEHVRPEWF